MCDRDSHKYEIKYIALSPAEKVLVLQIGSQKKGVSYDFHQKEDYKSISENKVVFLVAN